MVWKDPHRVEPVSSSPEENGGSFCSCPSPPPLSPASRPEFGGPQLQRGGTTSATFTGGSVGGTSGMFGAVSATYDHHQHDETLLHRQDRGRSELFPFILHDLLRDLELTGNASLVSWTQQGGAFQVHREDVFRERLLPIYFRLDTMEEFRSTLQAWGFEIISARGGPEGEDSFTYRHPDFLRENPRLHRIARTMQQHEASRSAAALVSSYSLKRRREDHRATAAAPAGVWRWTAHDAGRQHGESSTAAKTTSTRAISSSVDGSSRNEEFIDSANRYNTDNATTIQRRQQISSSIDNSDKNMTKQEQKASNLSSATGPQGSSEKNFLTKLRNVLDRAERDPSLKSVIGWTAHGLSFKVYKREDFVETLLPECVDSSIGNYSFETFQRILRQWGFLRITQGHEEGSYFNRLFQRDQPSLVANLTPKLMQGAMLGGEVRESAWTETKQTKSEEIYHDEEQEGRGSSLGSLGEASRSPWPQDGSLMEKIQQNSNDSSVFKDTGGATRKRRVLLVQSADDDPSSSTKFETLDDGILQSEKVVSESSPPTTFSNVQYFAVDSQQPPRSFRINIAHDSYDVTDLLFPWQLHRMLDEFDHQKKEKAVSWSIDGSSFHVYNQERLLSELLPKYFSRFMSWNEFTAELSNWGFVCFTSGPQQGAFIHRLLLKGKPAICKQMRYKGKTVSEDDVVSQLDDRVYNKFVATP